MPPCPDPFRCSPTLHGASREPTASFCLRGPTRRLSFLAFLVSLLGKQARSLDQAHGASDSECALRRRRGTTSWHLRPHCPKLVAVPKPLAPRLALLADRWRTTVTPWTRRACAALLLALVLAGAHLARFGTPLTRACAAGALLAMVAVCAGGAIRAARIRRDGRRLSLALLSGIDRSLARRAARAVSLAERTSFEADELSAGLARYHLDSILARVGIERMAEHANSRAGVRKVAALVFGLAAVAALAFGPRRVVEGLDVLIARSGRAPFAMDWLEDASAEVLVPSYLRQMNEVVSGFGRTEQPVGSSIVVRGTPLHADRKLVLTDGIKEIPLVYDARGALVARWTLTESVLLSVAARFGDVLVTQRAELDVVAIADQAPHVLVQDAPRTVRLLDVDEIPITYDVVDDHGVTQVDLVLRVGDRQDRRVLAKLDGRSAHERGSVTIRRDDRLLKSAVVPVDITVEARDNDPITGPKWGVSAHITVQPPAVAEAEALRYEALKRVLDELVDQLAERVTHQAAAEPKERAAHARHEMDEHARLRALVDRTLAESRAGMKVPQWVRALAVGQMDRMEGIAKQEIGAASAHSAKHAHQQMRAATENAALALDLALRRLATADATRCARRLAEVADEAAAGVKMMRTEQRDHGRVRLETALGILDGSAIWLQRLDRLGHDLGEVIQIGLRRERRCLEIADLARAELVARDLSARLRRPYPSFSGGGGRRSTEAGAAASGPGESGSERESQADRDSDELDQIAREHAEEMKQLDDDLARASSTTDKEELRRQAREHAKLVRDAVRELPSVATDPSSEDGAAAVAKEGAHAMADALEQSDLREARARGRGALQAIEQARRVGNEMRNLLGDPTRLGGRLEQSKTKLEREVAWTEQQLNQLKRSLAERARDGLQRGADSEERLARRTGELSRRSRDNDAPPPHSMLQMLDDAERFMREASRALQGSDAERGTDQQRHAQRLLEMAREIEGSQDKRADGSDAENQSEQGDDGRGHVEIPKAESFRGPEAFRKRVLEGLGSSTDSRLRESVRRYAEGLLR